MTELGLDFRVLLDSAPDGIAVVDDQGRMLVVNERMCSLFGYAPAELEGASVEKLVPSRLRNLHVDERQKYQKTPTTRPMGAGLDLVGLRKDGSELPIEISLSPLSAGAGSLTIAVVRDISERRRFEGERQTFLAALEAERERQRIGMDLHDGIMQDIYAVSLGLEMAQGDIRQNPGQAEEGVSRSIDQLHNVIRDIRSFIFDLRPRQFTGDVRQALSDLGREFEDNSGISTRVLLPPRMPDTEQDLAVALYLIAHEALSNTRKHAQASEVQISLSVDDGAICLEVRDDGRGFDPSIEPPEGHRGLRNMASRARAVGADLSFRSAPGRGTAVRVEFRRPSNRPRA